MPHLEPGRGRTLRRREPRVILPPLMMGTLGGPGFFKKTVTQQRRIVIKVTRRIGEKRVVGKLRAVQVLTKRTSPTTSRRAKALSRFVASSFIGRRRVRTGTGLSR